MYNLGKYKWNGKSPSFRLSHANYVYLITIPIRPIIVYIYRDIPIHTIPDNTLWSKHDFKKSLIIEINPSNGTFLQDFKTFYQFIQSNNTKLNVLFTSNQSLVSVDYHI